jgi:hypothetical protein
MKLIDFKPIPFSVSGAPEFPNSDVIADYDFNTGAGVTLESRNDQ